MKLIKNGVRCDFIRKDPCFLFLLFFLSLLLQYLSFSSHNPARTEVSLAGIAGKRWWREVGSVDIRLEFGPVVVFWSRLLDPSGQI
jgi:hypothetical protein